MGDEREGGSKLKMIFRVLEWVFCFLDIFYLLMFSKRIIGIKDMNF